MSLDRLGALRFRNLQEVSLSPSAGINLIVGENGSGKTSLLEAAYFLTSLRSFRDSAVDPLIARGAQDCLVTGRITDRGVRFDVGVRRSREGDRDIRINGERISRGSELALLQPVLVLGPHSVELLLGPPAVRRRFLNWGLFHVEHSFTALWEEANRCLKQRNLMLRHRINDPVGLETWTNLLIQQAEKIDQRRRAYMAQLTPIFSGISRELSTLVDVRLDYHRGWGDDRTLAEIYVMDADNDQKRGYTQKGFQRADVRIMVDGQPASKVCSRGELKALVWSLILAQGALLQAVEHGEGGREMLYLVDDLASEFDSDHRQRVCRFLAETGQQALVTGVDPDLLLTACESNYSQMFHVKHGQVDLGRSK